nr:beta-ketoacyl synthase N-terminal-like domain-containing protein [Bifidobacterium catenulatum]
MSSIAIIGFSGLYPDADSPQQLYRNLLDGRNSIVRFSDSELRRSGIDEATIHDPSYKPFGTRLRRYKYFDNEFFGMTPAEAQITDPQHRIFLQCSYQALQHAGYDPFHIVDQVGVFACLSDSTYVRNNLTTSGRITPDGYDYATLIGNSADFLATRVSYKLNLTGPSLAMQTACSSSLTCLNYAIHSLESNECDIAVVGGVGLVLPHMAGYTHLNGSTFSASGTVSPFDRSADGMVRSSGCSVIVIQKLDDALRDHNHVHAIVEGIGINNDGNRKIGFTAPSVQGQVDVIRKALSKTHLTMNDICYVETHGTGTALGDPIEFRGIQDGYETKHRTDNLLIGSVKANIGHLDAAAGITGVIKVVMSLSNGILPRQINYHTPNPHLAIDASHIGIPAHNVPLTNAQSHMAVTALGLGGTNVHCILSKFDDASTAKITDHCITASTAPVVIVLNAVNDRYLRQLCLSVAQYIRAHTPSLEDIAYTCYRRLGELPNRICFSIGDVDDLALSLEDYAACHVVPACHNELARQWLENGRNDILKPLIPEGKVVPLPYLMFQGKEFWVKPSCKIYSKTSNNPVPTKSSGTSILDEIIRIWSEFIGVQVHSDDRFSDLCSDSLTAVSIAAQIGATLNLDVDPTLLQIMDTPARLAKHLRVPGQTVPSIIPISTGGQASSLYMIHPAGGSIFCYRKLFDNLDVPFNVFGIAFPQDMEPVSSVQDMAKRYACYIMDHHDLQQPLVLGGYSLGGNLALAVASELRRNGVQVKELIFIDSIVPEAYAQSQLSMRDYVNHFPEIWGFITGNGRGDIFDTHNFQTLDHAIRELRTRGSIPETFTDSVIKRMFHVWVANHQALCDQHLLPDMDVGITLLYARQPLSDAAYKFVRMQPYRAEQWTRYCKALHVVPIPGDHYSIFSDPDNSATLRRVLHDELQIISARMLHKENCA